MKKFLLCGMGSVMQRHFRNLKLLLPDCKINVYTAKKNQYRIIDNKLDIFYADNLFDKYDINDLYHNLEDALEAEMYDAVFIGTLPPERIDVAIKCAIKRFNLFIEKPLSNNLDKVYKLRDIIEEKNLKCAIGFQMRFHSIMKKINWMLEKEEFGEIYRIEVNHCQSIYHWTRGRSLKDFYALKKECGGGVLMSQVHEIDYLTWIFGRFCPISAIYGKWLLINSDVEDNVTILNSLEKRESGVVPIIINLDFLAKVPKRELIIHGTDQTMKFDLLPKDSVEWNNLFINELNAFIDSLNGIKDNRLANIEDGIHSLEYICDIKDNFIKINKEKI